jgi:hypothetical protein
MPSGQGSGIGSLDGLSMHLKDVSQWDLAYVRGLPAGEFDWLDFKDSRWLDLTQKCLDKFSSYVSAFANYDGGYLVVGVKDPEPGQGIQIGEGVPLSLKPDLKGWLEDIIPNLTDPPVKRLNVHLITDVAAQVPTAGHALVVVHIPQSDAAPHQAADHKYYTRIGSKLSALGHKAVLDIVNRKRIPRVRTEIIVNLDPHGERHNVFWRVTNLSNVFVRYVMTKMDIPTNVQGYRIRFPGETIRILDDGQVPVWSLIGSNSNTEPLFPYGTVSHKFEFQVDGTVVAQPSLSVIRFRTFADCMEPAEGMVPIDAAGTT